MSGPALPPVSGFHGLVSSSLEAFAPLDAGWELLACEADAFSHPRELPESSAEWLPATAPGTVAGALRAAGQSGWEPQVGLDSRDYWFRIRFQAAPNLGETAFLHFEGLATLAEVFLNGEHVLSSDNMFRRCACDLVADSPRGLDQRGVNALHIRFRSLEAALVAPCPRARWRTRLVSHRNLRYIRTSLLGHLPGICPPVPTIGPWRPVARVAHRDVSLASLRVMPSLRGHVGVVEVALELSGIPVSALPAVELCLAVGDHQSRLRQTTAHGESVRFAAALHIDRVQLWWPHTHGVPHRYPARIEGSVAGQAVLLELVPIGFRSVELVDPLGDAEVRVNGASIFCRGACWTPLDMVAMTASRDSLQGALEDVRDCGMNMLRITGNMAYEATEFYELCDLLGILVWQDFMFASMDYPTSDPQFVANIEQEVRDNLDRIAYRACLAVLCGGTELLQQPAMLGLEADTWRNNWFETRLPQLCGEHRPDVPYCVGSPAGGVMPFYSDRGISHYFGVGAYRRPLADAWMAEPRFASECLAFAIPTESRSLAEHVPRDVGADWDFMDITDHYLGELYGCDPAALDDVTRSIARRATVGETMSQVQAVWRRPDSRCRGSLVWLLRDLRPGAGCGIVDASGRPKAPFFYLRRVWAPVALFFLDRGMNGLRLVVANESASELRGEVSIVLSRLDGTIVGERSTAVACRPRWTHEFPLESQIGAFVDSSYAYRFGPPGFDIVTARLSFLSPSDAVAPMEAVHLRDGVGILPKQDLGLRAQVTHLGADRSLLRITSDRFAQTVTVDAPGHRLSDNYFHLCAGPGRELAVKGHANALVRDGWVTALNAPGPIPISLSTDADDFAEF